MCCVSCLFVPSSLIMENRCNIEELQTSHMPAGPVYKNLQKRFALMRFKANEELKGIHNLCESHAPTYRIKAMYRYDRMLQSADTNQLTINKNHVSFNCPKGVDNEVQLMLDKIAELPKEWTIVQITSQFNARENLMQNLSKRQTDSLHMTVFNCGQRDQQPFCIDVKAPAEGMEIAEEMKAIITENKNVLFHCFGSNKILEKITLKQKQIYSETRNSLNNRLKAVINDMEKHWLGEWRSLLIGKFVDEQAANAIFSQLDCILNSDQSDFVLTKQMKYILQRVLAASLHLTANELMKVINFCIPATQKELRLQIYKLAQDIGSSFKFKPIKRHPVILILDERLDFFPWEMLDVLIDHPVSRMPSLHFSYALYKEHEHSIQNGFKVVQSKNSRFIINPGLDLNKMEARLKEFFQYWLPDWKGIIGKTPTSEEFGECLTSSEIFVYSGHGSGTQFLSASKIQQMRVNSVVLLFGCSSVRMDAMGPFVEMYDVFHNYLIACSPCVVGMLWEVTDFDTDCFSTGILSYWLASKAKTHWKRINKSKWEKEYKICPNTEQQYFKSSEPDNEPELLRAINIARKLPIQFMTKSAIVARGLPIKIIS